ncbi:MAG: hypothetical protein F7B17_05005 [Desulfurococcales archaeon]|nr:hypothetical protein [Desulfurococcales archaeon]
MSEGRRIEVKAFIEAEKASKLSKLAEELGTDLNTITYNLLDVLATYAGEVTAWARVLRVKKHNKPISIFEELIYYGVEAWRGIVARVLERLNAKGRYELEELEFDPDEPSIEMELVALEGSDLKADRLRIYWSMKGVVLEAYYYLEEGEEPPHPEKESPFKWDYLPDEHAVVITVSGEQLRDLPPVHVLDKVASEVLEAA